MVYHMETASRMLLAPYLEQTEEAVGGAVLVKHLRPARIGAPFMWSAPWSRSRACVYTRPGLHPGPQDREGSVLQVVMTRSRFARLFEGGPLQMNGYKTVAEVPTRFRDTGRHRPCQQRRLPELFEVARWSTCGRFAESPISTGWISSSGASRSTTAPRSCRGDPARRHPGLAFRRGQL